MIRKLGLVVTAILIIIGITAGGCGGPGPCASLGPPTPAELQVAASGGEIEREVGSVECELRGGTWVPEESDGYGASWKSTKTITKTPAKAATKTTTTSSKATRRSGS